MSANLDRQYRSILNVTGGGVEIVDTFPRGRHQPLTPPRTFGWYSDAVATLKAEGFCLDVGDRYYLDPTPDFADLDLTGGQESGFIAGPVHNLACTPDQCTCGGQS